MTLFVSLILFGFKWKQIKFINLNFYLHFVCENKINWSKFDGNLIRICE